jgi:hypothetical protein
MVSPTLGGEKGKKDRLHPSIFTRYPWAADLLNQNIIQKKKFEFAENTEKVNETNRISLEIVTLAGKIRRNYYSFLMLVVYISVV